MPLSAIYIITKINYIFLTSIFTIIKKFKTKLEYSILIIEYNLDFTC